MVLKLMLGGEKVCTPALFLATVFRLAVVIYTYLDHDVIAKVHIINV